MFFKFYGEMSLFFSRFGNFRNVYGVYCEFVVKSFCFLIIGWLIVVVIVIIMFIV